MTLTEFFYSLPAITTEYNKYATYSLHFNNPYRLITGYDVYKYDQFDDSVKRFITAWGPCIAMPNIAESEVIGLVLRAVQIKRFGVYIENSSIPYGAGINNKPFDKPWVMVESALDSDFLREFYPYVLATNGVAVSKEAMDFVRNTSSVCYCAYDNDQAGENGFHRICQMYSGGSFKIKRLKPPSSIDGKPLKDFGEILECLYNKDMMSYEHYLSTLKCMMLYI